MNTLHNVTRLQATCSFYPFFIHLSLGGSTTLFFIGLTLTRNSKFAICNLALFSVSCLLVDPDLIILLGG